MRTLGILLMYVYMLYFICKIYLRFNLVSNLITFYSIFNFPKVNYIIIIKITNRQKQVSLFNLVKLLIKKAIDYDNDIKTLLMSD